MDKIKIMALGGLDEDGKDIYVIEVNDDIFIVNGGFKYPDKNTPGIDFIIADFSYLKENKDRVKAFILTKSKKNSFGAIPYIYYYVKAPIYCTEFTKMSLLDFSKQYQQERNYDFHIVKLPAKLNISGHVFDLFSTCSSMPSTFGFSLRTSLGNIVYSSDFIVEYSNEQYFNLDLNTLGKIAEYPTLLLMSESVNSGKLGYCSPNHRLYTAVERYFKEAPGRIFISLNNDNFYHMEEIFKLCKDMNKKICFYDQTTRDFYALKVKINNNLLDPHNIIPLDDVLRVKDQEIVIMISDEAEKVYEKVSILANRENEEKQIRINTNDTFIMACPPTDNNEVICTSTIDELYKSGCFVKYVTRKNLAKMHAYEEDLKMLLSLLKPKYYFPIEGYYVNLLSNAKLAFEMHAGLSHKNIFLLDNGQSLSFTENGCNVDYDVNSKVKVGDLMIDGIGVGDVVNEIISERTRLSEDGVVVLACTASKSLKKIICSPDVQMRGFLFLKDKDADAMLREITKIFMEDASNWIATTKNFDSKGIEGIITQKISKLLIKANNRKPVIKPNIVVVD